MKYIIANMNKLTGILIVLCCFSASSLAARPPPKRINQNQLKITELAATPASAILSNTYWDAETQRVLMVDLFGNNLVAYSLVDNSFRTLTIEGIDNPAIFLPVNGTTDQYIVSTNETAFLIQWDGESDTVTKGDTLFEMPGHIDSALVGPGGSFYVGDFDTENCLHAPTYGLYSYTAQGGLSSYANDLGSTVGGVIIESTNTYYHLDACGHELSAFDWDPETNDLSNKRHVMYVNGSNLDVLPIGLTADSEDNLYTGLYGGSSVIKIDPSIPAVIDQIYIPTPLVLAPIFGGPNNDMLFVATGMQPIDFSQNKYGKPRLDRESGDLYIVEGLGVKGIPSYRVVV